MLPDHVNIILLSATVPNTKSLPIGSGEQYLVQNPIMLNLWNQQANEKEKYIRDLHITAPRTTRTLPLRRTRNI